MNKLLSILFILVSVGGMFYFSSQTAIVSSIQSQFFIDVIYNTTGIIINSFIIRKLAHLFMFMMISISISLFIYIICGKLFISTSFSFVLSSIYAIFDEYRQTFVIGRSGNINDVIIDITGVIIGIIIIGGIIWIIRKKK